MSDSTELPEPDRAEGAPHPRETSVLFGQAGAEAAFLDAFNSGRMHHGWLLTGPRGVGKATLAWRIARFLLAQPVPDKGGLLAASAPPPPAENLDVPASHPVAQRIAALSEPGLMLIRRSPDEKGRMRNVIAVEDVRKLRGFFGLSATEGGRRVVIVDCADEMNPNAANALLKLLEEPPKGATLLLVSHQPSSLLPTIRSRCRALRLASLGPQDMAAALAATGCPLPDDTAALTALAGGSVGEAIRLAQLDGAALYAALLGLFDPPPQVNRSRALALAEKLGARGADTRLDLGMRLFELFLVRLARTGVNGPPAPEAVPGEATLMARLCPNPQAARDWAELAQTLSGRVRHGRAVNLDPAALVLDMVLKIDETAARLAA